MANTFDMPLLVHQVETGKFRLFRGNQSPDGPIREPGELPPLFQIIGPLDAFFRLSPPTTDLSRQEVMDWLQGARDMGCKVQVVEIPLKEFTRS